MYMKECWVYVVNGYMGVYGIILWYMGVDEVYEVYDGI